MDTNTNNLNLNAEIWKAVKNYPNYEVSNMGRVRKHWSKEIVKASVNTCGYLQVTMGYKKDENGIYIQNKGKRVQYRPMVQRLVAEAFLPNPSGLPQVNHISEDKTDNRVCNLEWVSRSDNMNHGTRNTRHSYYATSMPQSHRDKLSEAAKRRGVHQNNGKKVGVILTTNAGGIVEFDSVRAAARFLQVNPSRIHYNAASGGEIDGYKISKKL